MHGDSQITHENATNQNFMPVMRALVHAYQAFSAYDMSGYAQVDLTVPQADVIFTLGNTGGLCFKDIGEKTLITKGTLTGVIERLENKGLVKKTHAPEDRRHVIVTLTAKGRKIFEKEFPRQIAFLKQKFDLLSKQELKEAERVLLRLQEIFTS
ncbi:MAG: MarR family winged helix-turn-helix transcriptional regulator [Gammaproteobacteria bacterium]|jgi:DNA-binding MarR family transcriptional regulator